MSFSTESLGSTPRTRRAPLATIGGLAGIGALHFIKPGPFNAMVPRILPGKPRLYTYASGAAEIGIAGLLAAPKTRRVGALSAIGLYVALFPANVQLAWDWRKKSLAHRVIAYGRLPLQLPLIRTAWRIYKNS